MLATTESANNTASVEKVEEGTKDVESLKATAAETVAQDAPKEPVTEHPATAAEAESEEDDEKMDVDDGEEEELDLEEEDMAEIDASNIVESRTRGVKIDFANLPEQEGLVAEEDESEDPNVAMDEE